MLLNDSFHEKEGVIKYRLEFDKRVIPDDIDITSLDQWRHVLFNLALIGQDTARYGGLGFGNISCRIPRMSSSFLISGSQTGHLPYLERDHCAVVTVCEPEINRIKGYGECTPSSESLTHGVLYSAQKEIGAVVHVHSPLIWQQSDSLNMPATPQNIPYGTPEMAKAVDGVCLEIAQQSYSPVFVMKGHVDGVVSYGADLESAVMALLDVYHRALLL
jgi:L-ribulose-5-phosphate 4-epimerase